MSLPDPIALLADMHEALLAIERAEEFLESGRIKQGISEVGGARVTLQYQLQKHPEAVVKALDLPGEPQLV